jgi:hypothetical protein
VSEVVSFNINRYIRSHNLPIRVIFTPGKKLRDIFCCSRPHDKKKCFNNKCSICPRFTDGSDCETVGVVYKVVCNHCHQKYIGETCRSCHERLMEHFRFATSPSTYPEEALSLHYAGRCEGLTPDLSFSILDRETSTVMRKIKEAFYIVNEKPEINLKEECTALERYLIKR